MGDRGWIRVVANESDIYNYYVHWGGGALKRIIQEAWCETTCHKKPYRYGPASLFPLVMASKIITYSGRMWTGESSTFPDRPWVLITFDPTGAEKEPRIEVFSRQMVSLKPIIDEDKLMWQGSMTDYLNTKDYEDD